jgi:hypothetical protein
MTNRAVQVASSGCIMRHMTKIVSPPTRTPRISVPVDAETLEVFERLAKAGNMSTGRAMAEWLRDTVEAAELMASTMERARAAPKIVTAELHAMMLGMADQTKELADRYAKLGKRAGAAGTERSEGRGDLERFSGVDIPPSCNTGGKVPKTTKSTNALKPGFPLPPAKVQAYADTNGKPPKAAK